jgi:hypothetical protein
VIHTASVTPFINSGALPCLKRANKAWRTATGIRIRRTAITVVLITNNPISSGVQKHFTSGGHFVEREQLALTAVIMTFLECVVVVIMAAGLCSKICVTLTTPNSVQETQLGPRRGVFDPFHTPSPSTPTHPFVLHSPRPTLLFVGLLLGIHRLFTNAGCERFRLADWRGVRNGGGNLERRHSIRPFHGTCFFDLSVGK